MDSAVVSSPLNLSVHLSLAILHTHTCRVLQNGATLIIIPGHLILLFGFIFIFLIVGGCFSFHIPFFLHMGELFFFSSEFTLVIVSMQGPTGAEKLSFADISNLHSYVIISAEYLAMNYDALII